MKISLNWLRQYVDVPETAEELARLLTLAGLEVGAAEHRWARTSPASSSPASRTRSPTPTPTG